MQKSIGKGLRAREKSGKIQFHTRFECHRSESDGNATARV